MKYRKRPILVHAEQWDPDPGQERMPPAPSDLLRQKLNWRGRHVGWELKTLEGWYKLTPGDWLICGIAGEWYPCKPDIFERTYEAVP